MKTKTQSVTVFNNQPLTLDSGQTLGPITQAYETYGSLNQDKTNVILIGHPLTGDAHAAGENKDGEKGWWDNYIGPNKAIDTTNYFVICINVLGGCKGSTGPSSINPDTNAPYGLAFPVITITDMVNAQKACIDHLGIQSIQLVIGGSMGGLLALEWARLHPSFIHACAPIAATGQVSPLAIAYDAVGRNSIIGDSHFNNGNYTDTDFPKNGLSIARMLAHITYLSEQSLDKKFGRELQDKSTYNYTFDKEFQIESYLEYQGDKFAKRFDPNSYLYLTKAVSYFDIPKSHGSILEAFSNSTSKFLIISITSDWLYTPEQSKELARQLMKANKDVTYIDIDSHYGHDTFLIKNDHLSDILHLFLERVS